MIVDCAPVMVVRRLFSGARWVRVEGGVIWVFGEIVSDVDMGGGGGGKRE